MKNLNATGFAGPAFVFVFAAVSVLFLHSEALAQGCIMTCPPNFPPVEVSVSSDCIDTLTYDEIGVTINGCTGDIIVDIMDNGMSIGDVITIGMAGNTYMVVVSNPQSGQSCMTNITVVDNQAPVVVCPADVTFECTADLAAYNGLHPGDVSDCSDFQIFFDDVLINSGNCAGNIISQYLRTYIIVDIFNNADTCEQLISLEKANLEDVVFPPDLTGPEALNCFPPPDTTPSGTGIPTVDGSPIINGTFCNLSAIYEDQVVPICSGSYKIFRTWTVFDWCDNNESIDSTQIIEIIDATPPVVSAPADMTVSTNALMCTASLVIPPADVSEDCSNTWTVRMQGPFGTIHNNGGFVDDLPVGIHVITFFATNDCGLEGSDVMVLTVEDLQPPVPVCNQTLAIPLNNEGFAIVPASVFDAASQDNCGNVYFKAKRMNLPLGYSCANPGNPDNMFDDFIQFCCEDIANNEIMVILRVYDTPPLPGPVSDSYLQGHFNDCMAQVEVQDKLPPQITCPSDLTVSCQFPFSLENLEVFGSVVTSPEDQEQICIDDPGVPGNPGLQCIGLDGLALDNCSVEVSTSAEVDINNCGLGTITRTFIATDDGGLQATCQQVITFINYEPFGLDDIVWPLDYTASDICEIDSLDPEDLPPPFGEPLVNEGICDLVATSYDDMVFDLTNDDEACFKILRTWTVIDWCQVNSSSGWMWTHLQVIKVMNTVAPVIAPIEDVTECSFDPECEGLILDFEANATDDCSSAASLTWRYSIDFDQDDAFDFISGTITGSGINFSIDVPIGSHRILYTVWDHCGNVTTAEQIVTVESCKGPSAKCIHGLSTNLMPMDLDGDGTADWGMVTIQAEMFDAGSDHPCGNAVTVAFSENPLDITRVFDCNDLGENEIELWVIDENGLTDFCITTIDIQDNSGVCPPEQGGIGTISGNIEVPNSGKLGGAMVYLDGSNLPGTPSGANGYFVFPAMPFGGQYAVRPVKEGDDKNGVTTLDLVRLQKHLLGIAVFDNPYLYIAADANNSKTVTAIDIVQLRKLILGQYDKLPNNQSWRFIESGHVFPNPSNPWASAFPETYIISPFQNAMNDIDFEAVKIGDLNLSASLNANSQEIRPRTEALCNIMYTTTYVEEDMIKVEVTLTDAHKYNALQLSLNWDQSTFELTNWQQGSSFSEENFRLPGDGHQNMSVAIFSDERLGAGDQTLVTLWFEAKQRSNSRFSLYLEPNPTSPVAYQLNEQESAIRLIKRDLPVSNLYNKPNPFKEHTMIVFHSSTEEEGVLRIFDASGKLLYTRNVMIASGNNEFFIYKGDLRNAGLYMYEIKTPSQHFTNRMIIVN